MGVGLSFILTLGGVIKIVGLETSCPGEELGSKHDVREE